MPKAALWFLLLSSLAFSAEPGWNHHEGGLLKYKVLVHVHQNAEGKRRSNAHTLGLKNFDEICSDVVHVILESLVSN